MIPRIKTIQPLKNYKLFVVFESGEKIVFDVGEDIEQIPDFSVLKTEYGMFENLHLDESRTCVYWSDKVDLPSDTLLEYGRRVDD